VKGADFAPKGVLPRPLDFEYVWVITFQFFLCNEDLLVPIDDERPSTPEWSIEILVVVTPGAIDHARNLTQQHITIDFELFECKNLFPIGPVHLVHNINKYINTVCLFSEVGLLWRQLADKSICLFDGRSLNAYVLQKDPMNNFLFWTVDVDW